MTGIIRGRLNNGLNGRSTQNSQKPNTKNKDKIMISEHLFPHPTRLTVPLRFLSTPPQRIQVGSAQEHGTYELGGGIKRK